MIRINCTNCHKLLSLDETKLPARVVTFPCPACRTQLTVDGRNPEASAELAAGPEEPGPRDERDEFGEKALIVGVDDPLLRQAVKLIGFLPVHHVEPERAREFYLQEYPQVVVIHPSPLTAPPLEAMNAILALVPSERRKSFFILIGEGLRTLDGNAAFLYGVNLVVAPKDLAQFPQIYREAYAAHQRFYAGLFAVQREKQLT